MASWSMKKDINASQINGGRKYEDNDGITTDAINEMFETLLFVDYYVKHIQVSAFQTNNPTPNVTYTKSEDGLLSLTFWIPRGEKGAQGIQGEKGETGDKGATFSLSNGVLTITSNT